MCTRVCECACGIRCTITDIRFPVYCVSLNEKRKQGNIRRAVDNYLNRSNKIFILHFSNSRDIVDKVFCLKTILDWI